MSRVSISAAQKPKPKETFKFLRRDEGRLSYSTPVAESPSKGGEGTPRVNRERKDSRALREAIAHDMKHAKSSDPFGDIVIAVPKRAPPPNLDAAAADSGNGPTPASKRAPPRQQSKSRPEWVNPDVPIRSEAEPPARQDVRRVPSEEYGGAYAKPQETPAAVPEYESYESRSGAPTNGVGRRGLDAAPPPLEDSYERRDAAGPPRRAASASRRYADPQYDDYDRNYFRRPAPSGGRYDMAPPPPVVGRSREEESLMLQLEQEVRSAQEERARYAYAKQQLDREKQRFDTYRFTAQQQIDDERAELDAARAQGQRAAQKDVKAIEERYRSVSGLLSTEREANRKLMLENDSLRSQLEETTAAMREQQKVHKAEINRLHREVESLTARNNDLLAMTREQQIQRLESAASVGRNQPRGASTSSTTPAAPPVREPSYTKQQQRQASADAAAASHTEPERTDEDEELVSVDDANENRSNGGGFAPVVMDFTPRSKNDPAKARRAREMEERMRREEEEMHRRRQQRERDAEERKMRTDESVSVPAAGEDAVVEEEERGRERVRTTATAAAKRKDSAAATAPPPEEAAKARKAAGHPVTTPRLQSGSARASKKKAGGADTSASTSPSTTTAAAAGQSAVGPSKSSDNSRFRIPTREELIGGDAEAFPTEEYPSDVVTSQTTLGDNPNKREILYQSGKREIHYANGTRKVVLPSGHTILHFTNGDVKCTYPSGKSTYWYDAAQTTHTQNPDGVQVFEFNATGQTERHLVDGTKEILYPDGIFKVVKVDGTDETYFPEDN